MFQGSQVGTERDIHGMSARRNESDTITANEFGLIRSKFVDPLRIQIPQYLHDFTAQGVATDLIAGEDRLVNQQMPDALPRQCQSCTGTGWTGSEYHNRKVFR